MPDPRIYQPTPLGDAPAPVPSWVQYEEEEKQRRRDEEAAVLADAIRTREDARKTARDLLNLGATGDFPGLGRQPSTADIQQTWSENVDPTRVAENPDFRQDYGLDPHSISRAFDRIPIQSEETGQWESGEPKPHIPEPPFGAWDDLTTQGKMEHVFHGMGVAMEEDPKFAEDINLDKGKELYKDIPILGSWQDFGEDLTLMQRTQNIVDGKGTKRDFFELAKVMHNADYWENEAHIGERAVRNIRDVAKYGAEFALTAGGNALAKEVGSELAEAALKKTGFKELMKRGAKRTASAISGGQQGMVRAGVMGMPMAGSTFVRGRYGPGNLEATEGGGYKMREQEDSAFLDLLESAAMAQTELVIETLPIGPMAAGVKNKFLQSFGREVAQEVAPAVRGGMKQSMAINSFLSEFGEERMIELINTAITRDAAHLGVTGMGEGSGRDLLDESIALGAMQLPFVPGRLARRASKIGAPIPTEPPTIERTETPVPSWQQEIVPAVDTLADPLPETQEPVEEYDVESHIDVLATDNLSSRRDFELVELPDGGTLLDSYPSKASREEFLEKRRAEMAAVEAPVEDTPLAELREAESLTEEDYQARLDANTQAELDRQSAAKAPPVAPPVIEEAAPAEEDSTPEENAVAVERIEKIDVMRVFPGRKVTEASDGNFDVHFEGGRWRVLRRDRINLTDKQKVSLYNDRVNSSEIIRTDQSGKEYTFQEVYPTVEDFLKGDVLVSGSIRTSNEAERAADATWDVLGTIEVAGGRGTDQQIETLAHEAVHAAHLSGLWTDKEWAALVKAYSPDSTTVRQQSEDIASKIGAFEDPGFMDKMVDWMNRMLSKIGLKELSPQAARNMFHRSALFNRRADTSRRVEQVPGDQAPMADIEGDKPTTEKYPMADRGEWYSDSDYKKRGGVIIQMTPDEFLSRSSPLEMDEAARDNIDDLKSVMQSGRGIDPLSIYEDDPTKVRSTDGRHRAIAAKELGIKQVPVIDFTTDAPMADIDPDATDPGDPNPFPKAIEAGEKQLSIMEGILKGMGDNAKPHHKGNVTRAKNRLAQLQIETRVEEEFNRNGKTAGYKWVEDPSKYNQVSVEERESAEERVEDEITPKIPDEPIEDLDAELDWRGQAIVDPETRIKQAVPVAEKFNRPYLAADRKPQDVIHHKDAIATVNKYRSGTEAERKEKDDAFIEEFLTGDHKVDIHTSIYAIQLSEELQLTGKAEDFEMSHAIAQRYRDINRDSARITAYGKHVGSELGKRHSRLREAIFERDKTTLALISLKKSKDPVEAAAGEKAWAKEQDRIAAVRKVVEDMGYAWTENGFREITKNRADQQKIVFAALYSKKGKFQRALEINSEYTIGAMLSGVNTLYTNFISGPATAAGLAIERRIESVANSMYNPVDITMGDYGLAKELKKLGIKEHELSQIIKDSLRNGYIRWRDEYGPLEESMGVDEVQQFEVAPAIAGKPGRVIRRVMGLGPMAASDQLTKTFYTTLNVRLHAAHIARTEALAYNKRNPDKEKLTDKDIKARATELLIDRESSAWLAAYHDALEITYQDEGGAASSGLIQLALSAKNVGKGTPAYAVGKIAEQSMLLFVRTPIRMFSQVAARTPVVGTPNVLSKMWLNRRNGRPTFQGVNKQIVTQIGVTALVILMAQDDDDPLEGYFGLSGSLGSLGEKKRKLGFEAVPDNAIRINKTWYKTTRVDPFDILISTLVDGVKSWQKGRRGNEILSDLKKSAGKTAMEKSVLRSVSDFVDAMGEEGGGTTDWLESALTRYIPGLYSQAARHWDENIYDTKTDSMAKNVAIKAAIGWPFIKGEKVIGLWGQYAKSDKKHFFIPDTRNAEMFKGNLAFQKWNDKHVDDKHQPMEFGDGYTDEDGSKVKFDTADKSKFHRAAGLLAYKFVDALVPKIHTEAPDKVTLEVIDFLRSEAKEIIVAQYKKDGDFIVSNNSAAVRNVPNTLNEYKLLADTTYWKDKKPKKQGGKYEDQPADLAKFEEMKAAAKRYREWLKANIHLARRKIRQ